ncbi:hypothetical protein B296_00014667 [Ensete ventricosum]|uniref:Uncharacterized protein n=1 Tax=Ensete ventricosum TaxID=4639 RepID=A0A426YUT2_ENSVE|nr:hypothetical protein B296_00014667 [Ensete ventricosum]
MLKQVGGSVDTLYLLLLAGHGLATYRDDRLLLGPPCKDHKWAVDYGHDAHRKAAYGQKHCPQGLSLKGATASRGNTHRGGACGGVACENDACPQGQPLEGSDAYHRGNRPWIRRLPTARNTSACGGVVAADAG